VDGVPADPKSVNMNDVESLEILKDASAASIYGANGANGVVLVTTKKGKAGKTTVNFSAYSGIQQLPKEIDVASGPEYAKMFTEIQVKLKKKRYEFSNPDTLPTYNYQKEIFRKAMQKSYDLGVSTGGDNGSFYMGLGYSTQDGILRNTAYNRLNMRVNGEYKANDWISFGENITFTQQNATVPGMAIVWRRSHPHSSGFKLSPFCTCLCGYCRECCRCKNNYTNWSSSPMGNTHNPVSTIDLLNHNNVDNSGKATVYAIVSPVKQFSVTTKLTGNFGHNADQSFVPVITLPHRIRIPIRS
jgi:TonB-dependent SusC/RagA subfamily outer membrane receptor